MSSSSLTGLVRNHTEGQCWSWTQGCGSRGLSRGGGEALPALSTALHGAGAEGVQRPRTEAWSPEGVVQLPMGRPLLDCRAPRCRETSSGGGARKEFPLSPQCPRGKTWPHSLCPEQSVQSSGRHLPSQAEPSPAQGPGAMAAEPAHVGQGPAHAHCGLTLTSPLVLGSARSWGPPKPGVPSAQGCVCTSSTESPPPCCRPAGLPRLWQGPGLELGAVSWQE